MKHWRNIPTYTALSIALLTQPTALFASVTTPPKMVSAATLAETSITSALRGAGMVYLIAIVISFGVAMLIKLLGKALKQFKGEL